MVPPSAHRRANLRVARASETEPPIWCLYPTGRIPRSYSDFQSGLRTLLESAAEVIRRSHLDRSEAVERQIALMPYSRAAFPDSSSYWHYSAAQVYFASVLSDYPLSPRERDGLFLDIIDLALLLPGYNGPADLISPGHRFLPPNGCYKRYLERAPARFTRRSSPEDFCQGRIRRSSGSLRRDYKKQTIVVTTHAGTVISVLGSALGNS